jgi:hypothetical protein
MPFVSSGTGNMASGTSLVVNAPASIVAGNLLLMFVSSHPAATTATSPGWTLQGTAPGATYSCWLLSKTAGGSEPSTYTVTLNASAYASGLIGQYSGVTGLDGTPGSAFAAASPYNFASLSPSQANDIWVGFVQNNSSTSSTPPSGFTQQVAYTPGAALSEYLHDRTWPSSSATGTASGTLTGGAAWGSIDVLLKTTPSAVTGTVTVTLGPLAVTVTGADTGAGSAAVTIGPLATAVTASKVTVGGCGRGAWLVLGAQALNLENPAGGYFCQSLDLGYPQTRDVTSNRPDQDGVDDRTQYMGARVVTAHITALAGAGARIDDVADNFAPFMNPAARPVLHYVLDRGTNPERTLTVRGLAYSWPIAGANQRDIQLQWVAADPIARDPTVRSAIATPSAPTTITSAGDVPARPRFRITGPITGPAVALTPTGGPVWNLAFLASFTVAAGHFVDVDTQARTVYADANPAQSRLSSIDWTQSSWQWVPPAPSSTTMTLTGTATSGATNVTATWQDGYLS